MTSKFSTWGQVQNIAWKMYDEIDFIEMVFVGEQRWANEYVLVWREDGKFYATDYYTPATEMQEDVDEYWSGKVWKVAPVQTYGVRWERVNA